MIKVVPADGGKWKILINWIQRGKDYTSKEIAENEANKLREAQKTKGENGRMGW